MKNRVDIRIVRPRTEAKQSIFEILEQFASLEGRPVPNCLEQILEQKLMSRWVSFVQEKRYPGLETT